jgi:hypothetical protein
MWKTIIPSLALLSLAACGDGKADAARQLEQAREAPAEDAPQFAKVLELHGFDMPLSVGLPEVGTPMAGTDSLFAQALWLEEFGHLVVRAGDRFAITIAEEPADVERLKQGMEQDLLRKFTIMEERPGQLIYKAEYPDSPELTFIHFYRVVEADGRTFVVEDMDGGQYNEAEIRFMAAAVQPLPLP